MCGSKKSWNEVYDWKHTKGRNQRFNLIFGEIGGLYIFTHLSDDTPNVPVKLAGQLVDFVDFFSVEHSKMKERKFNYSKKYLLLWILTGMSDCSLLRILSHKS